MTQELEANATRTITVTVQPPDSHIAQYRWGENSGGTVIALTPHDDASADVTGVAVGQARVTLDTVNADGTPGPSYSEDVDVTEAPSDAAPPAETGDTTVKADSVSFEWSDGAEVAPTPSEDTGPIAPAEWSAPITAEPATDQPAPVEENPYGA